MVFVTTRTILNENLKTSYNPNIQKLYSFFFFFLETVLLFAGFFKKFCPYTGTLFTYFSF